MTWVALKGLAERKLRALLTALAIVLGVAMISGTLVLTDTIKSAFDQIFAGSYTEHRRRDHRQVGRLLRAERRRRPSPPRCSPRCSAPRRRASRRPARSVDLTGSADHGKLIGRDGKPLGTSGNPTLRLRPRPGPGALQPADPDRRPLGRRAGRDRDRLGHRRSSGTSPSATGSASPSQGPIRSFTHHRASRGSAPSTPSAARRRGLRHPDGPAAARQERLRRRSRSPRGPASRRSTLAREIEPLLPAARGGADRRRAGEGGGEGHRGVHQVHPLLPARVRRRRAVRRRVRHLQHALDHRRPALARAGDAAHARRLAAAGAALGDRSRAASSASPPRWSGSRLGFGLAKGLGAASARSGLDLPQAGTVFETRTVVVSLVARHPRHPARQRSPRRSARRGCRRSPPFARARRCRAAASRLTAGRRRSSASALARAARLRAVRRRRRDRHRGSCRSAVGMLGAVRRRRR